MIECYYSWCRFHCIKEPFCILGDVCKATEEELIIFSELRIQELRVKNALAELSSKHNIHIIVDFKILKKGD